MRHHIEEAWQQKVFTKDSYTASTNIANRVLADFQTTSVPRYNEGGLRFGALVAVPINDKPYLIEYETNAFQPEIKVPPLIFVSMGSGQLIADSFLGFIRRAFLTDDVPSVREGVFATLWTIDQTIRLHPGGVGGEPQIAVLERGSSNDWTARKRTVDELGEPKQHCAEIEKYIRDYKKRMIRPESVGQPVDEVPKRGDPC